MTSLTESGRPFDLNGTPALALGHVDTLRHLTHHLLEPSWGGRLRLVGLVDLLRYGLTFRASTDWRRVETSYPFVMNALRCLHYVIARGACPLAPGTRPRIRRDSVWPTRGAVLLTQLDKSNLGPRRESLARARHPPR